MKASHSSESLPYCCTLCTFVNPAWKYVCVIDKQQCDHISRLCCLLCHQTCLYWAKTYIWTYLMDSSVTLTAAFLYLQATMLNPSRFGDITGNTTWKHDHTIVCLWHTHISILDSQKYTKYSNMAKTHLNMKPLFIGNSEGTCHWLWKYVCKIVCKHSVSRSIVTQTHIVLCSMPCTKTELYACYNDYFMECWQLWKLVPSYSTISNANFQ